MATVRHTANAKKGSSPRKPTAEPVKAGADLTLPDTYLEPGGSLDDFSVLIHGPKKIGKTRLSLEGGRVMILQHDPPQKSYRRMEALCKDWETFMGYLKLLEKAAKKSKFPYDRVVIDRADIWFRNCQVWACAKLAIEHPSEEGWGKGWDLVRQTFTKAVCRVLALPCGKWFICHSDWEEVETRDERKFRRLSPNLTGMADDVLNGRVDMWAAYDYDGKQRVLIVRGNERVGAGHRIDGHFLDPEGEPLEMISMGRDAGEGFQNFMDAFNNEYQGYVPLKKRKELAKKK